MRETLVEALLVSSHLHLKVSSRALDRGFVSKFDSYCKSNHDDESREREKGRRRKEIGIRATPVNISHDYFKRPATFQRRRSINYRDLFREPSLYIPGISRGRSIRFSERAFSRDNIILLDSRAANLVLPRVFLRRTPRKCVLCKVARAR